MKRKILKDFVLTEISSVDRPAQVGAKMSIIKRKSTNRELDMSTEDLKKLEKQVSDLTNELASAKTLASLTDIEKQYIKDLSADDITAFVSKSSDDRAQEMTLAKADDETLEVDGTVISKGAVGVEMFSVIKSQQAQIKKQELETRKAREVAMQAGFVKRASDDYPLVPGTSDELGTLLRETEDLSKGAKATLSTVLAAIQKMNSSSFMKAGSGGGDDGDSSAVEKLDTLAKAHAEKHNMDYATAYSAVIEKNTDLYAETLN